ncbi:MAG: hypothetical protein HGA37_09620 [Lentimicrobium sp.]|nr:hypothetical protein [Lentimicrobium sp.]
MKRIFFSVLVLSILLSACTSQQVIGYWVNKEALPKEPFKKIFILALLEKKESRIYVEDQMAALIESRGQKSVKSYHVFPPEISMQGMLTREQLAQAIKNAGCDGLYIISLLDTRTESHYQPGTAYYPMGYGYYGSYYGYYNYYYPQVYQSGYYITDQTYYVETNFFDVEADQLLWSIQSDAYNPTDLQSMFKEYSRLMLYKLKKEGVIK